MNGVSMASRSSRRKFLANASVLSVAGVIGPSLRLPLGSASYFDAQTAPEYTLRIRASAVDIGNKHFVSAVTYNDQFPGPLLRFKEGQPVTVEIHNDSDTAEQLHWHGQFVPTEVDGATEEGTPSVPAHGTRRITFTPRPAGFRFCHTHNRAGSDLHSGQYSGQVGPAYIEPKHNPGEYDRGCFSF
jgi:FtsP/CotA-like multicopper oxidase with cupredoxin domain